MRLRAIVGIGPITADAAVATAGNAREFKQGRQMAAWLGLLPMQHSSGGHARLGEISCRGDACLRTLLIQGAHSSLQRAKAVTLEKAAPEQRWIRSLNGRMPFGKVIVAIAISMPGRYGRCWLTTWTTTRMPVYSIPCTGKATQLSHTNSIHRQRKAVDNGSDHPGENLAN